MFDDNEPKKPKRDIVVGEDLYDFSVEELTERIEALTAEIERIKVSIGEKQATKSAADALFKS